MVSPEAQAAAAKAANRLHHLSMRYSGALAELGRGQPVGFMTPNYPGLREARDLIDLILFTRAEINCLTKLLIDAKVFTGEQFVKQQAEEYEWFAQTKAKALNVGLTDEGIVFHNPAMGD